MSDGKPIIVVKKKGGHGGHHGGAWKVAYADFVTAMMAFFMVMWLVNSADTVTKKTIASYFKKPGIFQQGSGTPLMIGEAGILQDAYVPAKKVYRGATGGEVKMDEYNTNIGDGKDKNERQLKRGSGKLDGAYNPEKMKLNKKKAGQPPSAAEIKALKEIIAKAEAQLIAAGALASPSQNASSTTPGTGSEKGGDQAAGTAAAGNTATEKDDKSAFFKATELKEGELTPGGVKSAAEGGELSAADLERKLLEQTAKEIKQLITGSPELAELLGIVDVKWENDGLNIEIVDTEKTSMFASGSAQILPPAQAAFGQIARLLGKLPNQVEVVGHTDAKPFKGDGSYTNWELSSDRALAARRLLTSNGIPADRITSVIGKADIEPRVGNKLDPSNRRITLKMRFKYNQKIGQYTAQELFKPKPKPVAATKPVNPIVPKIVDPLFPNQGSPGSTTPPASGANSQTLTPETITQPQPVAEVTPTPIVHGLRYTPKKLVQAVQSKKDKKIQIDDAPPSLETTTQVAPSEQANNPMAPLPQDQIFKEAPIMGPADLFLGQ